MTPVLLCEQSQAATRNACQITGTISWVLWKPYRQTVCFRWRHFRAPIERRVGKRKMAGVFFKAIPKYLRMALLCLFFARRQFRVKVAVGKKTRKCTSWTKIPVLQKETNMTLSRRPWQGANVDVTVRSFLRVYNMLTQCYTFLGIQVTSEHSVTSPPVPKATRLTCVKCYVIRPPRKNKGEGLEQLSNNMMLMLWKTR